MIEEVLDEANLLMESSIEFVTGQFAVVRTGRANPQIVQNLRVTYYGASLPLQQLANFTVPDPRLLVIHPYDKSAIPEIEKALHSSDLGINPANDGAVIRLAFPPLTEERRMELIRIVRRQAEDGRVSIRNVRRGAKSDLDALKGLCSDDDLHRAERQLQELTDQTVKQVDELLRRKEAELLEV
ncbi:MAG: ribosome recycling factor [Acidimicrobiia bacterium]|nr:ribosome recycling factor [bacterium]MYD41262.1 ribosome recycling factor [Acidimicrobiia bacterium]